MQKTLRILTTITSLIILTFFIGTAQAQVCTGDYIIESGVDIAVLSGCTEVTGNLEIAFSDLASLSGLEGLTSIVKIW